MCVLCVGWVGCGLVWVWSGLVWSEWGSRKGKTKEWMANNEGRGRLDGMGWVRSGLG